MCRNIKPLFNFDPPASEEEIRLASTQFVRKLSGFSKPSKDNEEAFNHAVEHIMEATSELLGSLKPHSHTKNREAEAEKAKARNIKRFGKSS